MKFFKLKKFLSILSVIVAGVAIVFILIITRTNHPSMSENDVRSQLEQTYDADVAIVKKNEAVYDALITKNGNVYSVEMNALTGEVNSLKQTDEYIIQTESDVVEGPVELVPEKSSQPVEQSDKEKASEEPKIIVIEKVPEKAPANLIISDKKTTTNKQEAGAEKLEQTNKTTTKSIISATSKIEEKVEEDKPQKEISKDSSKVETTSKQEETKTETPKEEIAKTEDKVELTKLVPAKAEATKVEEQKKEETQVQVTTSNTAQSEVKKPEAESKTETVTTVLISEEQAIKKAQQQQKGTVESSSFVKTNEGGYYLIVMKATSPESENKENAKEKKTKATIQVHAISGKILSVTWE